MSSHQMVTLRDGSQVPENSVPITMFHIRHMILNHPFAFSDLVEKCKDISHRFFFLPPFINSKKVLPPTAT